MFARPDKYQLAGIRILARGGFLLVTLLLAVQRRVTCVRMDAVRKKSGMIDFRGF
jgi:hypothetical protein